jgi:putative phage-type endonuclease
MRIIDVVQGTPEWHKARLGLVTASHFSDLMSQVKSGESAGRRNYRARLICEILTGEPYLEDFQSDDMKRGIEVEAEARAAYEAVTMQKITQVGLVLHPKYDRIAASPDGIIAGTKGLLELKCPKTGTHLETLLLGVTPSQYRKQMLAQMMCCEADWVDFCSYDPRLPKEYQLIIFRFMRDEKEIILMEAAALQFLSEVDSTIAQIKQQPVFRGI